LTKLPETFHHRRGFGGQAIEQREIGVGESIKAVAVEVDDADDLAIGLHRGRHFAADVRPQPDIPRIGGDIGHELRASVERNPAGDALA